MLAFVGKLFSGFFWWLLLQPPCVCPEGSAENQRNLPPFLYRLGRSWRPTIESHAMPLHCLLSSAMEKKPWKRERERESVHADTWSSLVLSTLHRGFKGTGGRSLLSHGQRRDPCRCWGKRTTHSRFPARLRGETKSAIEVFLCNK